MISSVKFKEKFRCFEKDTVIDLRQITLLVGDQGSGKSSLLHFLSEAVKFASKNKDFKGHKVISLTTEGEPVIKQFTSSDFEKENIRTLPYLSQKIDIRFQLGSYLASHGETVNACLRSLPDYRNTLILMDEPDMALSPKSAVNLANMMKTALGNECQIIVAIHNPIIISLFNDVFDMSRRIWCSPHDYFETMGLSVRITTSDKG